VDPDKKRKVEETVAALQARWGVRAVGRWRSEHKSPIPHLPTTFPALDEALLIGGLPRGRISEIIGVPTSGMATIALQIIASAQEQGSQELGPTAIYIDPEHTFDPAYAAQWGLELNRMVLVRPFNVEQALAIMRDFILSGGISILVFDAPFSLISRPKSAQALATTLDRIIAPLGKSNIVLLFLSPLPPGKNSSLSAYPAGLALPHFAAVRLFIQRESWIYKDRDISGYRAQVLVLKNKLGPAGQRISISLALGDEP
jgi:recombination protein RecA